MSVNALDEIAQDEAAARRAGQIVENILKNQSPGYVPQTSNHIGYNGEKRHGRRRHRRRHRGRGGSGKQFGQNDRCPTMQSPISAQFHAKNNTSIPTDVANQSHALPQSTPPSIMTPVVPATIDEGCVGISPTNSNECAGVSPANSNAIIAPEEIQPESISPQDLPTEPVSVSISSESALETASVVEPVMKPAAQSLQQRRHRRRNQNTTEVSPQLSPDARKVVLLNATEPGEIRVAILENGELAEIFMERKSRGHLTGNIYKGRVTNIEPSLQAAFVDLGAQRNGFLHASDCIPPNGGYSDILNLPEIKKTRAKHDSDAVIEKQAIATSAENSSLTQSQELVASNTEGAVAHEAVHDTNATKAQSAPIHGDNRRRRNFRGRSGRARPPNAAPMIAPTLESKQTSKDNLAAPEIQSAPAPNLLPIEIATSSSASATTEQSAADNIAAQNNDEKKGKGWEEEGGKMADEIALTSILEQPTPIPNKSACHNDNRGRREHARDRRYTIQEMMSVGQEVLVQVSKEGIGQKGPALTNYLSMPGRYLVLMPAMPHMGVSKRIESEEQRRTLKEMLRNLNAPEDMGVIARTAGTGHSKEDLQRDMDYLLREWNMLKKKSMIAKSPALLYQEGDVVSRVFRDVITDDVAEIIIDDSVALGRAREFLREIASSAEHKLKLYSESEPLFHKYGVEQQLQRLFNRKITLRSGGSIVIEQTEALVAIDVNTGRFREKRNQDDTILQTNLEAAREIARQLRLRDIGGLVMIDFIDMEIHEHRRRVERELKAHLARDKARINVLPISSLGVVEMTRQRIRHSLRKTLFDRCPHCSGLGQIKSAESLGLEMLREIKAQLRDSGVRRVKALLNPAVAFEVLNQFRKELAKLEDIKGVTIEVRGDSAISLSQIQISTAKESGELMLKKVNEVDDYVRNS